MRTLQMKSPFAFRSDFERLQRKCKELERNYDQIQEKYSEMLRKATSLDINNQELRRQLREKSEITIRQRLQLEVALRDWIHTQPWSLCDPGADTCPDWDKAFEIRDVVLGALKDVNG